MLVVKSNLETLKAELAKSTANLTITELARFRYRIEQDIAEAEETRSFVVTNVENGADDNFIREVIKSAPTAEEFLIAVDRHLITLNAIRNFLTAKLS